MSRNLELVLVGVIFLVLLLVAPDILLAGSAVAWWVARRSGELDGRHVARAAMWGGAAVRLALLVLLLVFGRSEQAASSAVLGFVDALLLSPALGPSALLTVGLPTLSEVLALGYAVRVIVTRLPA